MINRISLIIAVLWASLIVGCISKHPVSKAKPQVIDLGVVEVSDGCTNRFDIGNDRICVVRSFTPQMTFDQKLLKQMILMITVEKTGSDGVAKIIGEANLSAYSGQKVGIQNEHEGFDINLTPHFKL